ncbi:MAG: SDR family NAD(P)-dependent oxidoreductase [Clostridia bacterium]|nr:SDR family NAD(P)-dependent oxidoreductase [Clostridia bacterium]
MSNRPTVIVTGGAKGIGAAICRKFALCGYNVLIHYNKSEERAAALKKEILLCGADCDIFCGDLSQAENCEKLAAFAKDRFGGIDVLINNAGVSQIGLFSDISEEDYERVFGANVKSAIFCSKAVLDIMRKDGKEGGKIINISSMWGICGASCEVLYSASKAAIIGLTKALAKELCYSKIRVNCIAPGVVNTDMFTHYDKKTQKEIADDIPLGYVDEPENIAETAFFLASDGGDYFDGQVLSPNGGRVI